MRTSSFLLYVWTTIYTSAGKAAFIPPTEERQPETMLRLLQHRVRCTFTEVCYAPIATYQCNLLLNACNKVDWIQVAVSSIGDC